jgi:hypothetical protein
VIVIWICNNIRRFFIGEPTRTVLQEKGRGFDNIAVVMLSDDDFSLVGFFLFIIPWGVLFQISFKKFKNLSSQCNEQLELTSLQGNKN